MSRHFRKLVLLVRGARRGSDDHIMMTGAIELEYSGEFERADFTFARAGARC
ncbi:MAG: hypothetical protein GY927_06700 [bacterium]|nr:hypothetical protein [bacterium]